MAVLSKRQVAAGLRNLPGWSRKGSEIRRCFEFKGFPGSVRFVNRVARAAEKSDHHPDIDIRWNRVTLAFSTHSEGGITQKDLSMARQCGRLARGVA